MINSDAALLYCKLGWKIFPVAAGRKVPLTEHGFHDASKDAAVIRRWWERWPDASIGVATGADSGFWALDVDAGKSGIKSLQDLLAYHGDLPETPRSRTGGGGLHILFKHTGDRVKNSVQELGIGLDVRGDSGYIVIPPSLHESGRRYLWEVNPTVALAVAPEWLQRQVLSPVRGPAIAGLSRAPLGNPLHSTEPITEGNRDNTLTRVAGIMRANGASAEDIYQALVGINASRVKPPLDDADLTRIARSIGSKPAGPALIEDYYGEDPFAPTPDTMPIIPNSERPPEETDLGNAKRMRQRHGADMRYCTSWDKWLVWTGTHWQTDDSHEAERRAIETAESIKNEAAATQKEFEQIQDQLQTETTKAVTENDVDSARLKSLRKSAEILEARRAALYKHAKESQSERALRAMRRVCGSLGEIAIQSKALDNNAFLLNCSNGTLDLRSGTLRPHDRADLITCSISTPYDPDATCPRWLAFLTEIMLDRSDVVDYLQRAIGYSLTGAVNAQVLFFMHGNGQNGKSTVINVLDELFGAYCATGAATLLEEGSNHPTEIADLFGKRMVMISEPEDSRGLPAAQIKRLTSEEPIKARRMREDFWQFDPTHKLWISGNDKPTIRGTDLGIWRRIQLIPFEYTIPESKKDPLLASALIKELPGILAWAVRGCAEWLRAGLRAPQTVMDATAEYREEEDIVGTFLAERCEMGPGFSVLSSQLYATYNDWAEDSNFKAIDLKKFRERLKRMGLSAPHTRAGTVWQGIRLIPTGPTVVGDSTRGNS